MKKLNIGGLIPKIPIIQGGMAVGVSLDKLSSAVANAGGIGVIGTAGIPLIKNYSLKNYRESSVSGLKEVIKKARDKTAGILGVNIMVALTNYKDMVVTSLKEKIDVIFSGAGLPLDLPSYLYKGCKTKLVPIISSVKAAKLILKRWVGKYDYFPDAFVLEGPKAGGHLGYKPDQIYSEEYQLSTTVNQLKNFTNEIKKEFNRDIPIIAGGAIRNFRDVKNVIEWGASGVQVGTPFIATEECDAHHSFKEALINATEKDITIIKSPLGLPGRALKNSFIESVRRNEKKPFVCPFHCLKTCDFKNTPYCIASALVNAVKGDLDNGFVFTGENIKSINKIVTVKEVIERLIY